MKEARKEAGLSQEQLAEKMSVSRSAIAKWENEFNYTKMEEFNKQFQKEPANEYAIVDSNIIGKRLNHLRIKIKTTGSI